ncbi:hypothetical protein CHELA1G11_20995 [Hyphomicrobiales bacterium]|nr:hypothetical protein CHELA1G11_20995 [Hyphomicrobiales bacterium]
MDFGISRGANPRYLSAFGIPEAAGSQDNFIAGIDLLREAWKENPLTVPGQSRPSW